MNSDSVDEISHTGRQRIPDSWSDETENHPDTSLVADWVLTVKRLHVGYADLLAMSRAGLFCFALRKCLTLLWIELHNYIYDYKTEKFKEQQVGLRNSQSMIYTAVCTVL